ncbi:hypothetical protein PgNI_05284 [Pyricularia grisea]|uniref:Caleosin domain-containing protein n=1 Tax=Pyricularia grisea TaxID=148305 RepID=A0A6P8B712_PYRGI|nr:hypothetical protein PgNI_05284 [Pyricularia grisea]TLD10914.1 hypothetical protein PgNI_05284 [Pyricularia grisea]
MKMQQLSNEQAHKLSNYDTLAEVDDSQPAIVTSIPEVPITEARKPWQPEDEDRLPHPGVGRANIAATYDRPEGTTDGDYAKNHSDQTVLQQHLEFFDRDRDGIIWPRDTFVGFYRLGFGAVLSFLSVFVIHSNFSYATGDSWIPDPMFRIYLSKIHKDKHGSASGAYDAEGRFVPQRFEDLFAKHAQGRDYMTARDVVNLLKGQRMIADPVGWFHAFIEWSATYYMLWPKDGRMKKEDVRGVFDGSIFYTIAARREEKKIGEAKRR